MSQLSVAAHLIAIMAAVCCAPRDALAQDQAIVSGVTAGMSAQAAASHPAPRGAIIGRSLDDWRDARTGMPSRLNGGCAGLTVELHLSGTATRNYLNLWISNDSGGDVAFLSSRASVRFGSGRVRRFAVEDMSDLRIESGWWLQDALRFPDKADFEGQNTLEIEMSFAREGETPCTLTTRFERDPAIEPSERTYVVHTAIEAELGAGPGLLATGGQRELGTGALIDVWFGWFPWVHHGFSLDIGGQLLSDKVIDEAAPTLVIDGEPLVSAAGIFVGYVARAYLLPWLTVAYNPTIGPYVFELTDDSPGPRLQTAVFPLRHRARITGRFATLADGTEFAVALSAWHVFVPYGTFGELPLEGHLLSLGISLVVGG